MKKVKKITALIIAALAIVLMIVPFAIFWALMAAISALTKDRGVEEWIDETKDFFRSFSE